MADQHENKSAASPTSTHLPSPTSTFVSSHTLAERPWFEIAERSQRVSFRPCFSQVSPDSSANVIPTEVRRPNQLQASNSVEPGRHNIKPHTFRLTSNVALGAPEDPNSLVRSSRAFHEQPIQDTQASRTQRSTAVYYGKDCLSQDKGVSHLETYPASIPNRITRPQDTRAPSFPRSPCLILPPDKSVSSFPESTSALSPQDTRVASAPVSPPSYSSTKPGSQSSRVLRAQSLKSLPSASSFRVPTRLSSLRRDTSAATDSFDTDLRPQTSVPAFLGRHRISQNAKSVQRAVSLGSIAELHGTAQQAYKNRTFSLPPAQQLRLSSLGERQKLSNSSLTRSRKAAITSVEDLRAPNDAALFIDIAKTTGLDVLFPCPSPRHHPIPLSYRCSNTARPSTASKQAVYVPLFVNQHLRPATTSSMRREPNDYCRVDKNGVYRPHGRSESTEELLGADTVREPILAPDWGRNGWRRWLRKAKDLGRRALGREQR